MFFCYYLIREDERDLCLARLVEGWSGCDNLATLSSPLIFVSPSEMPIQQRSSFAAPTTIISRPELPVKYLNPHIQRRTFLLLANSQYGSGHSLSHVSIVLYSRQRPPASSKVPRDREGWAYYYSESLLDFLLIAVTQFQLLGGPN